MLNDVIDNRDLLKWVITVDESWIYGYDVKTKVQSTQWKSLGEPRPKKSGQVRLNVNVLQFSLIIIALSIKISYYKVVR